jgi:hypothetical protein
MTSVMPWRNTSPRSQEAKGAPCPADENTKGSAQSQRASASRTTLTRSMDGTSHRSKVDSWCGVGIRTEQLPRLSSTRKADGSLRMGGQATQNSHPPARRVGRTVPAPVVPRCAPIMVDISIRRDAPLEPTPAWSRKGWRRQKQETSPPVASRRGVLFALGPGVEQTSTRVLV